MINTIPIEDYLVSSDQVQRKGPTFYQKKLQLKKGEKISANDQQILENLKNRLINYMRFEKEEEIRKKGLLIQQKKVQAMSDPNAGNFKSLLAEGLLGIIKNVKSVDPHSNEGSKKRLSILSDSKSVNQQKEQDSS